MEKENLIQKYEKELAVLIAVQHLGQPTIDEIKEYCEQIKNMQGEKLNLQLRSIKKYCTILQKKGLISSNYRPTEQGQVLVFSMQKGYVKLPEIAQIKDIIKEDSLQVFIDKLENKEGIRKPKSEFNDYLCKVTWKVLDGVAGFYPNSDGVNIHYRRNGKIIFFPNHFRKYIAKNLSKANKSQYVVDYIGFTYGESKLNSNPLFVDDHFVGVRGDIRALQALPKDCYSIGIHPKGKESYFSARSRLLRQ